MKIDYNLAYIALHDKKMKNNKLNLITYCRLKVKRIYEAIKELIVK